KPRRTDSRAPDFWRKLPNERWNKPEDASAPGSSMFGRLAAHLLEHGGGGPAVEPQPVRLLIGAEREPGLHAGFAVDFLRIIAEVGEPPLHLLELGGLELHHLGPWRFECPPVENAIAQLPYEQHVEIGEIVVFQHEIVRENQKTGPVDAGRQQERRRLRKLLG